MSKIGKYKISEYVINGKDITNRLKRAFKADIEFTADRVRIYNSTDLNIFITTRKTQKEALKANDFLCASGGSRVLYDLKMFNRYLETDKLNPIRIKCLNGHNCTPKDGLVRLIFYKRINK